MIYNIKDNFYVRTPYFPLYTLLKIRNVIERESISDILKDINFEENLAVSSTNLYEAYTNSKKINKGVEESLYKYVIRSSSRCTPFGLTAGIHKGNFSQNQNCMIFDNYLKHSRPDMEWISFVIKKCEELVDVKLRVTTNNTLKFSGNTIEKMWNSYLGSSKSSIGGKTTINNTKAVKTIFEMCNTQFIEMHVILEELTKKYPEMTYDFLKSFLFNLLENEFLISELRPSSLILEPLKYIIKIMNQYNFYDNFCSTLINIDNLIDEYNNIEVSKGMSKFQELVKHMKSITESKNYLNVDMYQKSNISLSFDEKSKLLEFANYLNTWSIKTNYEEYCNKFIEKYDHQAIKYLDVIDSDIGIGVPISDFKDINSLKEKISSSLIKSIFNSDSKSEIDLSYFTFDENTKNDDCIDFQLSLIPYKNGDGLNYLVSPLVGAKGLNKIEGRFTYLFENEKVTNNIIANNNSSITVELTYPPCLAKHSNIQLIKPESKYILEYGTKNESNEYEKILLENVYMFIDDKRVIRFVDKASGRILNFVASHAYNQVYCPPILKPLLEISENQQNSIFTIYYELHHILLLLKGHFPKIKYKDILMVPESWVLDDSFYKNNQIVSFNEFKSKFENYKTENNMPNLINVGPFDKRLILNLENSIDISILYDVLKQDRKMIIFESIVSESNLIIHNSKFEKFVGEFIFSFEKNIKVNHKIRELVFKDNADINRDSFFPLDNWIYLKLYLSKSSQDKFIMSSIDNLINTFIKLEYSNKLFYIRYFDTHDHIRLRINTNSKYINEIIKHISEYIHILKKGQIINNCTFDTYFRETERYGGVNCIEAAESLFSADSIVCVNLLKLRKEKLLNLSMFDIYLISCFKLLNDMGITAEDQLSILDEYRLSNTESSDFRKHNSFYQLSELFGSDLNSIRSHHEGLRLMLILEERSSACYLYAKLIMNSDFSFNRIKGIVLSVLHMHFNRLLGINRQLEIKALSYLRKFIYMKVVKFNHLGLGTNKNDA